VDVLNSQPTREASQGAGWRTIFRERVPGRVRYTVCLRNLDNRVGKCWRGRTGTRGRSRIFVALFVNDQGGPGRWRARWKVAGRVVATWRFRVRPEFGCTRIALPRLSSRRVMSAPDLDCLQNL
jgi:hypothetical protein